MLVVYTIEKEAYEISLCLTKTNAPTFKHLSFKCLSSEERIAATHANELINATPMCETLYNAKLNIIVKH